MSYGFTCGYCDSQLDTPHEGYREAGRFAQASGWRVTCGPSARWGDGPHNTCPDCLPIDGSPKDIFPIWTDLDR